MQVCSRLSTFGALTSLLAVLVSASLSAQDKDGKDARERDSDKQRPKLTLKAQPIISIAPSKVTLRAELVGGANDYEEFYCPSVEWDWGDGTHSESTTDCEPYEPGKSQIKRRFTVEHIFRAGYYKVVVRLKRRDKALASATATVQVQGGASDLGR
jgi:hypothetical protein